MITFRMLDDMQLEKNLPKERLKIWTFKPRKKSKGKYIEFDLFADMSEWDTRIWSIKLKILWRQFIHTWGSYGLSMSGDGDVNNVEIETQF